MRKSTLPAHYTQREHNLDMFIGERFGMQFTSLSAKTKNCLNPLLCDASMLRTLAHKQTTDFWNDGLTEEDKRRIIYQTIRLKRTKGTIAGIQHSLHALDLNGRVEEWSEYGGSPFHFKVDISTENKQITSNMRQYLSPLLHEYKNVRSVLDEIRLSYVSRAYINLHTGGIGETCAEATQIDGYTQEVLADTVSMTMGAMGEAEAFATMGV